MTEVGSSCSTTHGNSDSNNMTKQAGKCISMVQRVVIEVDYIPFQHAHHEGGHVLQHTQAVREAADAHTQLYQFR